MTKRSRRHKKRFACGHQGFGQFCRRCIDQGLTLTRITSVAPAQDREVKQSWLASFEADPIDLRGLPRRIVLKARSILKALQEGECYTKFKGKRLSFDRTLIRIPVTRRYRLLCRDYKAGLVPIKVLSHEAYNPIAANKKSC